MSSPPAWPEPLHRIQRRYLAEDLVRLRRSDEQRRYAAPQRSAKIDANPHQIEAVIFALSRVREGGCILADEVGLGKTIEAGLVIAQLMAEGARRVLLVAPKPLIGQWRQELYQLFGLEAREGRPDAGGFAGEGVILIGREAAGSERGRTALLAAERFDLCVIDEAHEVFAGLYKRFDSMGQYDPESPHARTAGRVREVLLAHATPVVLLTATPIQNSLTELWGLVQYVDPLGTLLGDLSTFRDVFCDHDDRKLAVGQAEELRRRISVVLQRTLRRQAQDFLEKPFVERQTKLFEYTMSVAERSLYDDVTRYLLEPGILGFRGSHRQLLLLGFHRRMASSTHALAESLGKVAGRLQQMLAGEKLAGTNAGDADEMLQDLEEEEDAAVDGVEAEPAPTASPAAIGAELARVGRFIERAEAVGAEDSKFRALLKALSFVMERARDGRGAGKLVIFTESRVTQDYLRKRLMESQLVTDEEITRFRGVNNDKRAHQALERWRAETPRGEGPEPSVEIATRLALVHEFRTRSRVFISTEAGAKGLNLQFCDTLVNYDLPWNPQRIEQRIGRCHRYGQTHGVTVINFLASDNEAQKLTFDILSQKLELFGTVLSATDEVLHQSDGPGGGVLASALGAEFEADLRRIYERSRTLDEVTAELIALRERVGATRQRFEDTRARTASLIEDGLDARVQSALRSHRRVLPAALADFDRDLRTLVVSYLSAKGAVYQIESQPDVELLVVAPTGKLPGALSHGITAAVGASKEHVSLHLSHPLVVAAIDDARTPEEGTGAIRVTLPAQLEAQRAELEGQRLHLRLIKFAVNGFERVERLVPVVVREDGSTLSMAQAEALMRGCFSEMPAHAITSPASLDAVQDAVDGVVFALQGEVDEAEHRRFEHAARQADAYLEDRLLVLGQRRIKVRDQLNEARRRRDGAMGSDARAEAELALRKVQTGFEELEGAIARLSERDDLRFRAYQEHIEQRRFTPPDVQTLLDMTLVIA